MKGFISVLIGCCAIFSLNTSSAANFPSVYGTLGTGGTQALDMPSTSDFANVSTNDNGLSSESDDYGARVALGLIWNRDKFVSPGLELGLGYYGYYQYSSESTSLETYYYGIEYLGMLQFNLKNLKVIGKAGFVDQRSDVSTDGFSLSDLESNNAFDPEVGAGLGYQLGDKAQINAMYYHIYGDEVSFSNDTEANNLPSFDLWFAELSYFF